MGIIIIHVFTYLYKLCLELVPFQHIYWLQFEIDTQHFAQQQDRSTWRTRRQIVEDWCHFLAPEQTIDKLFNNRLGAVIYKLRVILHSVNYPQRRQTTD